VTVVWIDTVDIATAKQLVQQLMGDFGGEGVMLTAVRGEVRVRVEFESSEAVARALEWIEGWLDETGIEAQISFGSGHNQETPVIAGGQ
jgi:hypothetical protein